MGKPICPAWRTPEADAAKRETWIQETSGIQNPAMAWYWCQGISWKPGKKAFDTPLLRRLGAAFWEEGKSVVPDLDVKLEAFEYGSDGSYALRVSNPSRFVGSLELPIGGQFPVLVLYKAVTGNGKAVDYVRMWDPAIAGRSPVMAAGPTTTVMFDLGISSRVGSTDMPPAAALNRTLRDLAARSSVPPLSPPARDKPDARSPLPSIPDEFPFLVQEPPPDPSPTPLIALPPSARVVLPRIACAPPPAVKVPSPVRLDVVPAARGSLDPFVDGGTIVPEDVDVLLDTAVPPSLGGERHALRTVTPANLAVMPAPPQVVVPERVEVFVRALGAGRSVSRRPTSRTPSTEPPSGHASAWMVLVVLGVLAFLFAAFTAVVVCALAA